MSGETQSLNNKKHLKNHFENKQNSKPKVDINQLLNRVRDEKKKERIFFPIKKYKSLNREMRMRVLDRSIKEISKSYYPPRSKKIMNLDINLHSNKSLKLYLAGCSIFKEKKLIIIKKT